MIRQHQLYGKLLYQEEISHSTDLVKNISEDINDDISQPKIENCH